MTMLTLAKDEDWKALVAHFPRDYARLVGQFEIGPQAGGHGISAAPSPEPWLTSLAAS
jgi:hypothetical protein